MAARTLVFYKWLILFVLINQGYNCQAQLKANFTATSTSGCAPIVVNFTDISTGSPNGWKWDLGNGTISYLRNPSVTYFSPGKYNVKLTVSNSIGKDSISKNQYITVYGKPAINFSASATKGCFPLSIAFTDLSTAGSGELNKWEWDFGDGLNASGKNAQHTYNMAGNFNVSLRVTNSFGCTQSITKPQYIQINTGVQAAFNVSSSNSCKAPATIKFINTSAGSNIVSYQWDFGDGSSSTLAEPSHLYTKDGSYNVKLTIKNFTGCTDTITSLNAVNLGKIITDFSVPAKICVATSLNILNTSLPSPARVSWQFGDGSTSTDSSPVKQYSVSGNYIIKMTANFNGCIDSVSKPVVVLAKPVLNFTSDKTKDCKVPFAVHFSQNVVKGTNYSWDFGDGISSADPNPDHTYNLPGIYDVKLIASNLTGCTDTLIKPAFIQIELPEVSLQNLPALGCAPFNFDFTSKIVSTNPVVSYLWNFGDGSSSTSATPSHTFLNPGSYTISLITTTAGGCTDTTIAVDGITIGEKPHALFNANPLNTCANTAVNFFDLSTGKVDKWYWDFGDGTTSVEQNPVHLYADTGYFTVTQIVINNGCTDTIIFNNYVHIKPPVAKYLIPYDCAYPLQRAFTDRSIGADKWFWEFGDGDTSVVSNPVHNYLSTGSFLVKLTVTNFSTGCTFTSPQTISVIDEKANFTVSDSVICKGSSIDFNAINSNAANIVSYSWSFGDGTLVNTDTGIVTHTYNISGRYSVILIVTDLLGCKDTLIKPLYIQVNGPVALFNSSMPGSCLNNAVTFIDSSTTDGINNIQQWIWSYGDGTEQVLSAPPFQHTYSAAGIYSVKLKVVDRKGCADSLANTDALIISQPLADFNTADTITCPLKPVIFSNTSTGSDLTYTWNFGDGFTSSEKDPVHQYLNEGTYSVSLSITDKYGCTNYILKENYIKVAIPVAGFAMSDSISNCPPLIVNFTNNSINALTTSWDFGDGNTSSVNDPSHVYAVPGIYNAVLTITSAGGCIDKKTKQVMVKGPSGNFNYSNIKGCIPLTTSFKASTKNSAFIIWDFNDGVTISTPDSILTHDYINPGTYLPKIIVVDAAGCQVPVTGIDTIVAYGIHANFDTSPFVLCDSGAVRFNDNSTSNDAISSYFWSFGDGTTSVLQNPAHKYQQSGLYNTRLMVTTQSGCTDTISTAGNIRVINSPKILITGDAGACIPAKLDFSGNLLLAADTSSIAWLWNFGNGNTSSLQNPPEQIYTLANSYNIQLSATNSSGCSAIANKTINTFPIPDVNIIGSSNVCSGKSVDLSVKGAATYSWTPATNLSCTTCANPVATPDSSIKYVVKGTSGEGCVASDSISISVKFPTLLQVGKGDTLCAGSSTILYATGGEKYIWSPSTGLNDPSLSSPVATPLQTTNYRVIASDKIGCYRDTAYVAVKVFPVPSVDAGEDKTINVGKAIDLEPVVSSDVTEINWSPTSGIFRNSYPGITVKPTESLEYTVEVSNPGGCIARDRVTVNVLCNKSNVFIPNTFSPNGDGANDIFYPRGSGVFQIKVLKVFNRWGEVVFEKSGINANDISSGWDGTYNGKKLLPDIFVYIMDVVCDNNTTLTFKGNVALVL